MAQPGFKRPRLVADAIGSMDQLDVEAALGQFLRTEAVSCRVSSVESSSTWICRQLTRVIEFADRFEQAFDDVDFVEERQLQRDDRELLKLRERDAARVSGSSGIGRR